MCQPLSQRRRHPAVVVVAVVVVAAAVAVAVAVAVAAVAVAIMAAVGAAVVLMGLLLTGLPAKLHQRQKKQREFDYKKCNGNAEKVKNEN